MLLPAYNRLVKILAILILLEIALGGMPAMSQSISSQVKVALSPSIQAKDISGRLSVMFASRKTPPPIHGPNWFRPEPFFAVEVRELAAGETVGIDDAADGYPGPLSQIPPGQYFVQAILDSDFQHAHPKDGVGNIYSSVQDVHVVSGQPLSLELTLDQVVRPRPLHDGTLQKTVTLTSKLLSDFHQRDVVEQAIVLLPPSYQTQPEKQFPVYYEITGFGATIDDLDRQHDQSSVSAGGVEFIHVMLTGQCKWGHHVYADSENNGPRATALIQEMIPHLESTFRMIPQPHARMLGGHSSGGWSSLWLQVNYPEFFGGVWSTAPDPVDFRFWQGTNLYDATANVLRSDNGSRKPLARANGRTVLWYDDFLKMDDVIGKGGQLRSFEAVFSPRGEDGLPVRCWDRATGDVIPATVEAWKKFDITRQLKDRWSEIGSSLEGKIHVVMGGEDTFFLDDAVRSLDRELRALGSDAEIQIVPGRDHFNLLSKSVREEIHAQMADQYLRGQRASR